MGMENLKRYFSLQCKKLEIQFATWNRGREIAKAYENTRPPFKVQPSIARVLIASAVLSALVIVLMALAMPDQSAHLDKLILPHNSVPVNKAIPDETTDRISTTTESRGITEPVAEPDSNADTPATPAPPSWSVDPDFFRDRSAPISTGEGNDSGMQYFLLANKKTRILHLLERASGAWSIRAAFPIATGRNPGRKMLDGDLRTPEGQYFIEGKKEAEQLSEVYGPMAYVLNYPNWLDRREGRTGSGIWIHGTAPDSMPVSTRGCIEMSNADLRSLSEYLHEGIGTPVLIVASEQIAEPESFPDYEAAARDRMVFLTEYLQHQSAFAEVLHDWAGAWESRQMANYRRHYDTAAFFGQGLKWDGWRRRKQRTFEAYDTIAVSFEDLLVTEYTDSTATVKFVQHYRSDLLDVTNGKRLDFVRRNDKWLITNESTFPQEELL